MAGAAAPRVAGGVYVVQGELATLVSWMRRNTRWAASVHEDELQDPLLRAFGRLKQLLANVQDLSTIEADVFLAPFLDVIRSEVTTGPITGIALSSVNKFLAYGLIDPTTPHAAAGIENIADAVTHAKFVGTDLASDEVVLMKILQVLRTLLLTPVGACMSNEAVCELMQSCFRICFEMRLSELLRRSAEQTLADMVHALFSRLTTMNAAQGARGGSAARIRTTLKRSSVDLTADSTSGAPHTPEPAAAAVHEAISHTPMASPVSKAVAGGETGESSTDAVTPTPGAAGGEHLESPSDSSGAAPTAGSSDARAAVEGAVVPATAAALSSRTNSRGVKFTPPRSPHGADQGTLVPYGIPCVQELLRFVISLINPRDPHNSDLMISMGLSLLTVALETGGHHIHRFSALVEVFEDELCRHLFRLLGTENLTLFAATLRVCFLVFESQRSLLKEQLKFFLHLMTTTHFPSYEHKEGALDCLLQLFRIPGFAVEMYINFDCSLYSAPVFEPLVKFLAMNAMPDENGLLSTHLIALDALMSVVHEIESRGSGQPHPIAVFDSLPEHPEDEPRQLVPPHYAAKKSNQPALPSAAEVADIKKRKLLLAEGMVQFNEKPKRGLAFLQEQGLLSDPLQPDEVAQVLRSDPRLDKAKIGEYIGAANNKDVLTAFVKSFDFRDKPIVEAMRSFLASFRLPGEAQIIDRILEKFAEQWHTHQAETVVANRDSAYVLAFSIILLNVDQHNPKNKKPMTLEQFIRNQRGINDNKDFPPEFLEDIYMTIKTREIVMPEEQEGELREDYEWKMLLARTREAANRFLSCQGSEAYDRDVFLQLWASTVAALSFVLDTAEDEATLQRITDGFGLCAAVCARFELCDVMDKLVVALCKRTFLSPAEAARIAGEYPQNVDAVSMAFGQSLRAQMAAQTAFALCHQHGHILREAWKDILGCVRELYLAQLLPPDLVEVEDFLHPSGRISLQPRRKESVAKSDSSFLSSISSYLLMNSDSSPSPGAVDAEKAARKQAKACIDNCALKQLFTESKFLQQESLQELVKALIFLSHGVEGAGRAAAGGEGKPGSDGAAGLAGSPARPGRAVGNGTTGGGNSSGGSSSSDKHLLASSRGALVYAADGSPSDPGAFFLDLLCEVALWNKDRISYLWDSLFQHLEHLIGSAGQYSLLVERAIVSLVRLANRLLHREDTAGPVLRAFAVLGRLAEPVERRVAQQLAAGLSQLIRTNVTYIDRERAWDVVLGILERAVPYPGAGVYAADALGFVVGEANALHSDNFVLVQSTALTLAQAAAQYDNSPAEAPGSLMSLMSPPSKRSATPPPEAADDFVPVSRSLPETELLKQLLQLLYALHTRVVDVFQVVDEDGRVVQGAGGSASSSSSSSSKGGQHGEDGAAHLASNEVWARHWGPLLQGICCLCSSPGRAIRQSALTTLQRALLLPDLECLSGPEWQHCLEQVLFPLLDKLLEAPTAVDAGSALERNALEEVRMRTCTLLCKVFLQHLQPLLQLPAFTHLWLRVLDFLDKYMHTGSSDSLLAEAIPETLKNLLLVMSTSGIFRPGGGGGGAADGASGGPSGQSPQVLWDVTWRRIEHFLPDLHSELFPDTVMGDAHSRRCGGAGASDGGDGAAEGAAASEEAADGDDEEVGLHPHAIVV